MTELLSSLSLAKTYTVTFHVFESHIHSDSITGLGMSDPYLVIFQTRDREGTKQKTSTVKRSHHQVWNQTMSFHSVEYNEIIRLELKGSKSLRENMLYGYYEFTVRDILQLMQDSTSYAINLETERPGMVCRTKTKRGDSFFSLFFLSFLLPLFLLVLILLLFYSSVWMLS